MPSSLLLGPILGALSHQSAKIWARADGPARLYGWLADRNDLANARLVGVTDLLPANGYAGVLPLHDLQPDTPYSYAVSLSDSPPPPDRFYPFRTFPPPGQRQSFAFAFGSCYLPPDEHGGQTFDYLRRLIETEDLRFGLFLGDQIYADAAHGNGLGRVAVTLDDYRAVYAHTWSHPAIRELLPRLPLFMTLDDHEVDNDWHWRDPSRQWADIPITDTLLRLIKGYPPQERNLFPDRVRAALKAYEEHQMMHAPDLLIPFHTDALGEVIFQPHDPASFAYAFYVGAAAFFMLDTRTMRVGPPYRILLGEGQWRALFEWLDNVKDNYPVKFLVSSCSLLHPFFFDIAHDRWSGFPAERERLLEFLARHEIEGVYILAGDLHSSHAVTAELRSPTGRHIPIAEFCASPFEQRSVWLSFGYLPIRSPWLSQQRRHFYRAFPNVGIVHVDFEGPKPKVTFTLHYHAKGWQTVSLTA